MSKSSFFLTREICFIAVGIILFNGVFTRPLSEAFLCLALGPEPANSLTYYVAPDGDDNSPGTESQPWKTIQKACDTLVPGSTVYVKAGNYNEKITVNVSGTASGGYITISNYENERVVIDGTGILASNIIYIEDKDYLRIMGFEICNNTGVSDGSGIRIVGSGEHIEISNNKIYEIRGSDAMGITVYGTDASKSISHLIIEENEIYNCEPAHSEALTLNGNVEYFEVTNNIVHDVNNIGIDFIGGEGMGADFSKDAARNGVCRGNWVYSVHSSYGEGYAAGIYIDGGNTIVVERNTIHNCDIGIEVGCETGGKIAFDNIVRDNFVFNNDKRGIGVGGYDYPATGKVVNCTIINNTCFNNDTMDAGEGELYVEYVENCDIRNNIFYSSSQNVLMTVSEVNKNSIITLDYNLWYAEEGAESVAIDWKGMVYEEYGAYLSGTGEDVHSQFDDPQFVSDAPTAPDLHVSSGSPSIDAGDPAFAPDADEVDIDGGTRVSGSRVDIGADEYSDTLPLTTTVTSETTTTIAEGETCLVEEIYGEFSEESALLRDFRDAVLKVTPEGQAVIRFYYQLGPLLGGIMRENKELREEITLLFDGVLPLIKVALP